MIDYASWSLKSHHWTFIIPNRYLTLCAEKQHRVTHQPASTLCVMRIKDMANCKRKVWHHCLPHIATHFDMKLQVFIHGIDVVKDILHYPGDDTHWICVMEVSLHRQSQTITENYSWSEKKLKDMILTSMVCVLPDDVCPYAKIVPLYPSRTSASHQTEFKDSMGFHVWEFACISLNNIFDVKTKIRPLTILWAQVLYTCSCDVFGWRTLSNMYGLPWREVTKKRGRFGLLSAPCHKYKQLPKIIAWVNANKQSKCEKAMAGKGVSV